MIQIVISSTALRKQFSQKVKIMIIAISGFFICNNLFPQEQAVVTKGPETKFYREELLINTDRDIYITGENVWFKVYELNGMNNTLNDLSKVVYIEVLDKNRFPFRQIKVKCTDATGSSCFRLPDDISSGNYIIRAYTNWMKNFPTDKFAYKIISVINPFENITNLKLPLKNTVTDSLKPLSDGLSQSVIIDEKGNKIAGRAVFDENRKLVNCTVTPDRREYSPREKVRLEITVTDTHGNPIATDLSVSVAKSVVVNSIGLTSFNFLTNTNDEETKMEGPEYLAELEGHLISGFLRSKSHDEPLKKTGLSLAYVGKTARCQFTQTDNNGEFHFVVKEPGLNEIVIQPLSPDVSGYYIELSQPFSIAFSKFKPISFFIDSSKIDALNKVIVNTQVNNIYEPFHQKFQTEPLNVFNDFYGKPESTIRMADYIELTTVKEVVKEIMPNVYTLKQNGKYDFKLINKYQGQPFENKPLVLIDGVPVYNFDKLLNIASREIEKADIINTRYYISDLIFDGIVSFVTKKGDLSVLEFDNTVFRQAYDACQNPRYFYSPDYSKAEAKNSRIPDFRNTLMWEPEVRTSVNGKAEISFYTSDETSDYSITVEGLTSDGKVLYASSSFQVK